MVRETTGEVIARMDARRQARQEEDRRQSIARSEAFMASLLEPGGVERYVVEGRIPLFQGPVLVGKAYNMQEMIPCHLPPEGARPGDKVVRSPGSIFSYISPTGEMRGSATTFTFTPREGRHLIARVQAALRPNNTG